MREKQSIFRFKTGSQVRHSLSAPQESADPFKAHGQLQKPGRPGCLEDGRTDESAISRNRGEASIVSLNGSIEQPASTTDGNLGSLRPLPTEFGSQVLRGLECNLTEPAQIVAIVKLLPVVGERSKMFFIRRRVQDADADDLSSKVMERIWHCAGNQGIRRNLWALVDITSKHLLLDYIRTKRRYVARFGTQTDLTQAPAKDEGVANIMALERQLSAFSDKVRAMAELRLEGKTWREVAEQCGVKPHEARLAVQRAW